MKCLIGTQKEHGDKTWVKEQQPLGNIIKREIISDVVDAEDIHIIRKTNNAQHVVSVEQLDYENTPGILKPDLLTGKNLEITVEYMFKIRQMQQNTNSNENISFNSHFTTFLYRNDKWN